MESKDKSCDSIDLLIGKEINKPELVSNELETFRQKWKKEVAAKYQHTTSTATVGSSSFLHSQYDVKIQEAERHFLQGIDCERNGQLQKAIKAYRTALQLDPEIEQRISKSQEFVDPDSDEELENNVVTSSNALVQKFSNLCISSDTNQLHGLVQLSEALHITQLPSEIICYIFRWVASSHVDMKSVESLSETCRKFYLCARDQTIWKAACERIWGTNLGQKGYGSWRRMFIDRPHVQLDGVYISKVTYFRQGDPTVMSSFYEPFQCVEYFRYLRFFENNKLIFYTTPDEPTAVLPRLKFENAKQFQFRCGSYRCHSEQQKKFQTAIITGILKETCDEKYSQQYFRRTTRSEKKYVLKETEYFMDLELTSTSQKKRFNKLSWLSYSCRFTYDDSHCSSLTEISLRDQYPPFYYSRVKSFNKVSHHVL